MAQFQAQIKKLAILCSGGDAPGMNAAIRAVVRTCLYQNIECYGVFQGYHGLLSKSWQKLDTGFVANVLQRGGTILRTGRCPEFTSRSNQELAVKNLKEEDIDALIVIGGNGSLTGAHALWEEFQFPVVGIPGTIDNDLSGTDTTIGFDTAVNTALGAIDRIRDTAASHDRLFIVEVMGRDSGFIAADVGLAGGAEAIFIPEKPYQIDQIINKIESGRSRGKLSSILITAEGQKPGRAYDLAEAIRKKSNMEARVCILGHLQRGGSPTSQDRILATRLGAAAVNTLIQGYCDVMVGNFHNEIKHSPISECIRSPKPINTEILELCEILSL